MNMATNKKITFKSEDLLLANVIKQICNYDLTLEKGSREIEIVCFYGNRELRKENTNHSQSNTVNITKEESILLSKSNNNSMLKSSLQDFFSSFLKAAFAKGTIDILGHTYFKGQPASFYLPSTLIIDVSKLAPSIIDPKGALSLSFFAEAAKRDNLLCGYDYILKGFICRHKAQPKTTADFPPLAASKKTSTKLKPALVADPPSTYYPVEVDWTSKTAWSPVPLQCGLSSVDDRYIHWVVYERKEMSAL